MGTYLDTPVIPVPPTRDLIENRAARPLSIASRLWIAVDSLYPPFWTAITFEGRGNIDRTQWENAIRTASEANKGSRLILRGHLSFSHWVDSGQPPALRIVDGSSWDGMTSEKVYPLLRTYDVTKGPTAEVLIFQGDPLRIMFRAHHAVMDGRGTMTWAEDIFRVLNGMPPLGSDHLIIENDLLYLPDKKIYNTPAYNFIPPAGPPRGSDPGRVWRRATVRGHHSKLLAKVMLLSARAARRNGEGPVRFGIPVDLRSRKPGLRSTGNLTNAIYVTIEPDAAVEQIANEIQMRLKERSDGKLNLEDKLLPYIPVQLLRSFLKWDDQRKLTANKFRYSGFISNVGKVDLVQFTGGGFTPTAFFAIPTTLGSLPFSLGIAGHNDTTEFILEMPKPFATNGRLEEIFDFILSGLGQMN